MAATVNTNTITNLPPVWASDDSRETLYQFRSIERTGYLYVNDLCKDFLSDAQSEGALNVVNVAITETHLSTFATRQAYGVTKFIQYTTTDSTQPGFLSQRVRVLTNKGAGYAVGDILYHFVNGARANVKIKVKSVDSTGLSGITDFEIMDSGEYDSTINPRAAGKQLEFRKRLNPSGALLPNEDYSYAVSTSGKDFYFQSRHEGNGYVGSLPGPTKVPQYKGVILSYTTGPGAPAPANYWETSFGDGLSNPKGRGGASDPVSLTVYTPTAALSALVGGGAVTRWPVDGIWANITPGDNAQIFPGSEIILKPGFANSESYIPPGTYVTAVKEIDVVDNVIQKTAPTSPTTTQHSWFETTNKYIYMLVSDNIKIDKGDAFVVKGGQATFSDMPTNNDTAEIFQVVTEATARIDPLATNRAQVTANVVAISGANVMLANIRHQITSYVPTIFESAVIGHHGGIDLAGATVASVANISYSSTPGGTTANIVTDQNLPTSLLSASNRVLTFDLPNAQPYRVAFKANGKQTLEMAVATSVQLKDDANVKFARVADYLGGINDITGYVGNVPTLATLSTAATESFTATAGSIGGEYQLTGSNVTRAPNLVTFTTMPATAKVLPGYTLNVNTVVGAFNGVQKTGTFILEQVLPLTAGEILGNKGRYYISKDYPTASPGTAMAFTSTTWGKVLDVDVDPQDLSQGFINRSARVNQYPEAYPMTYYAAFARQGMFFGVWEGSWAVMQKSRKRQINEGDSWFNWMVIQRPVHRKTGAVRTSGQSPVFCINSVGYKYWKFVVRERDVMHPTQGDLDSYHYYVDDITGAVSTRRTPYRVPADAHTEDSHMLLNTSHQIALTEDSKYLVSFMYNLTTPRFRYSDELDLIGQTAADVAMASSDVKITAYGEAKQRVYKALAANLPYNAGLRVCVLKDIYV